MSRCIVFFYDVPDVMSFQKRTLTIVPLFLGSDAKLLKCSTTPRALISAISLTGKGFLAAKQFEKTSLKDEAFCRTKNTWAMFEIGAPNSDWLAVEQLVL